MKPKIYWYLAVAGAIVLITWVLGPSNTSSSESEGEFFALDRQAKFFEGHPEPVLKQKNFELFTDRDGQEYFACISRERDAIEVQPLNGDPYFTIRPDSFYTADSSKWPFELLFCHKIVSWDSIFLLDRDGVNIHMCDTSGHISTTWQVTSSSCPDAPFKLRSFSFSSLQVIDHALYATYLPFPPSGEQSDIFSCNAIAKVELPPNGGETRVSVVFGPYSNVYTKPEVGYGMTGYIPSFTPIPDRPDNAFILSFPKDHRMFRVNERLSVEAIPARSDFVNNMNVYEGNLQDVRYNQKYETEEPRYWQVMYDPYREQYYRIVLHRQKYANDIRVNQFHEKPWSIMVFDKNFRKLGEDNFPAKKFFPEDLFVGKEGLYVSNAAVEKGGKINKYLSFTLFKVKPRAL